MPANFKKYNIDGNSPIKKKLRRGSENPSSLKGDDYKYSNEPYIQDEMEGAAYVVTGGMGEKSFSKRRL